MATKKTSASTEGNSQAVKASEVDSHGSPPTALLSLFRENLSKIVTTVVAALVVAFLQWEVTQVTGGLVRAECEFTEYAVDTTLEDIQLALAGMTLDDLDMNSALARRLSSLADRVGRSPKACDPKFKETVEAANRALRSYIDRQYQASLSELAKMNPPRSSYDGFFYQVRGAAQFHLAMRSKDSVERANLREAAKNDLERADTIAQGWGGVQGARIALVSACRKFVGQTTREANLAAVKCLNRMKQQGIADYNTYFNLAQKYARLGNAEGAIENLEACIDLGCHRRISKEDAMRDGIFDQLLKGPQRKGVEGLLQQFKI